MKLKKTLLAGATATTLALAGTGIASAQDGEPGTGEPTGSSQVLGSLSGSSEDSDDNGIVGSFEGIGDSLNDLFGEEGALGSFNPDGGDWWAGLENISTALGAVVGIGTAIAAIIAFL